MSWTGLGRAAAALLVFGACNGQSGPEGTPGVQQAGKPVVVEAGAPDAATPPPAPATVSDLRPKITARISDDGGVSAIVVSLVRPLVADTGKPTDAAGCELKIDPPVDGKLVWAEPARLEFQPSTGFAPSTQYTATLTALRGAAGPVALDEAAPAKLEFTTPAFSASRAVISAVLPNTKALDVDVVFTGPVDAKSALAAITLASGGTSLRATPGPAASADRVRLHVAVPAANGTLDVKVADGVRSAVDGKKVAPAKVLSVPWNLSGKAVEVKDVRRVETTDGFLVEVVCNDPAGGDTRYWRDPIATKYAYYYLSPRCSLDPEKAAEWIHVSPPVDGLRVVQSSGGFRVYGSFQRGTYSFRVDAGATTVDGGTLMTGIEKSIDIPARTPTVSMVANQGRYLPRNAWSNLPVRHLNVDRVHLVVRHVPPANLVYWLSSGEDVTANTGDIVVDTTVPVDAPADESSTTWLDLSKLLPGDRRGVYQVAVSAVAIALPEPDPNDVDEASDEGEEDTDGNAPPPSASQPAADTSRLVLTDLNLVAKAEAIPPGAHWTPRVWVWTLDMASAAPVSGVDVEAVRPSGKVMAKCSTDGEGGCSLDLPASDVDPQGPIALIATHGDDTTYLKFADVGVSTSEFAVGGEAYTTTTPYRASIWTERGVYRPGETVHLAAVVRDRGNGAPPETLPVTFDVTDANGKLARSFALQTTSAGTLTADLPLAAFAGTGSWSASLKIAGKVIQTQTFAVEEFVPERMKVTATPSKADALADEAVTFGVDARYLFGGSAAGSRVDVDCRLDNDTFGPTADGYTFGVLPESRDDAQEKTHNLGQTSGEIGEDDHATLSCPAIDVRPTGPATLVAEVSVFEAGSGRTTRSEVSARIHPEKFYLGLRSAVKSADIGKAVKIEGEAVDWNQKPTSVGRVTVEIYDLEEEWGWWWYYDYDEYQSDILRHLRRSFVERRNVDVGRDGHFSVDFTPAHAASAYVVRTTSGNAASELLIRGSAGRSWYYGDRRASTTPKPLAPTPIALTTPDIARVGEPIEVEAQAPWAGRLLFTAETDHVLAHTWVDVPAAGPVKWKFQPTVYAPNVYISAFLVKDPHLLSAESYVPDRAFGVSSVKVEPTAFRMAVTLDTPAEIRSNSPLKVGIDLGPQSSKSYVTVAAVDEGILSLTKFKTPDPEVALFPTRALGVWTYETIGWTMMLPGPGQSSSTGGDAEGTAGRVQPVKAVALWSGAVEVDVTGKASVTLDVPQYHGQLRVMVVAANGERVGSASSEVIVRDPLVIQTTIPRFLTDDDTFEIPVFLTNASGKDRAVTVKLTAEAIPVPGIGILDPVSPLEITSKPEATFNLKDGENRTVAFRAKATAAVGAAKLRVVATSDGGIESTEELDVPFSPAGPRETKVQRVTLAQGKLDLGQYLDGWVPTTEQTTVWVTPNPYGESFAHLKYLIHYPYGCIEQTSSATRPLLYVRNIVPTIDSSIDPARIDDMVRTGIERILSMQTPSGGFAYWPGESEPAYWASAYATHVLMDAKAQGYDVPDGRIDEALAFLGREVDRNAGRPAQDVHYGWFEAEPYVHYVLAKGGKAHKARIESLLASLNRVEPDSAENRYLLQAALYLAGDRRYEKDLRSPDTSALTWRRDHGWSFWSDLRSRGMMLSTYEDLFGNDDKGGEELAQVVARGLAEHQSYWYSTQEIVWGVTGLGKRVGTLTTAAGEPSLTANGKALKGDKSGADRVWHVWRASELSSLQLDVPSVGTGTLYLVMSSEGVRKNATYAIGGDHLKVSREFLTAEGKPINAADHHLGDLVYTRITVTNTSAESLDNLAVVDRLPAGWEIENPKLGHSNPVEWADPEQMWPADHVNLRDDRLELFGSLNAGETRTIVYTVRAVTSGTFTIPPIDVEAMYDSAIWARGAGGTIEVKGPWDAFLL